MFNEPVVGEKFFGRQEILDLLNKRACALKDGYRQNVALTGQSLAGKSSIILHFLENIKEEGFIPIYVEVVKEPFRSFANKFIATMLYNSLTRMGNPTSVDLDEILQKSQKVFPKTSFAIKRVNSYIEDGSLEEAYSNLLGLTSVLKDETGLSCIVILDEFDNLELIGIKNPFLSFGKVIMVQKDTMYVVSSSRNKAIKQILSEKLSLLFGNFEVIKVANFDLKTSGDYIDMKLSGFDIDPRTRKFLLSFTDGNPFYLDKLAGALKELAMDRMSSYVDNDMLAQAILDTVYNANGVVHQYLMNYLLSLLDSKARDLHISVLVAIASGQNIHKDIARCLKKKQTEIASALTQLLEIGLLSKNGVFYKIDDAVLKFWIKFVYQRRKELLVDGTFSKIKLFKDDIDSYLLEFCAEDEKNLLTRISELFNSFSNELVQIESRNLKLPHFTKIEIRQMPNSRSILLASFNRNFWALQAFERDIIENDIVEYIKNTKLLDCKVSNKIIMPLKGIDENARLLAKELKISIWDNSVLNSLLNFYGKKGFVLL